MANPRSRRRISNPESPGSLDAHKLALSRELLDDIELSRLNPEQMLLKASRLARLVEDGETRTWLDFELKGYPNTPDAHVFMDRFNRWTDKAKYLGYWHPFASLGAWATAQQAEIQQLRVPDVSLSISSANPHEYVTGALNAMPNNSVAAPVNAVISTLATRTNSIAQSREIQSRVVASVHDFAVRTYYRLAFRSTTDSIFREHQTEVDKLLRSSATDVLEKIPAIMARLAEGDPEAISQAMNSCRRMIKTFADSIQPASNEVVTDNGHPYQIGSEQVLNRIKYFLARGCPQSGRSDRLQRNLRAIWERASAGTHADVTPDEARALFLQAYMTLGEILGATQGAAANKTAGA